MLGGANTGKSTFLVQLYGRMTTRMGRLVSRCAPAGISNRSVTACSGSPPASHSNTLARLPII